MILIITESLDTRMNFRRYLRKNGILCQAPPPADFEASVASGRYSAVLFFAPFFPVFDGTFYLKMTILGVNMITMRVESGHSGGNTSLIFVCNSDFSSKRHACVCSMQGFLRL